MKHSGVGLLAAATLAIGFSQANADEFTAPLAELAEAEIRGMLEDPAIVAAIRAQNADHAGLSQADIDTLDQKWRAEVGSSDAPTISPVLEGEVASMLRALRDESGGLFTEIFVMDNHGLNVAASDTTSDYWQGDEAKWQQTFKVGPDAVHVSDVELDESTQSYQGQVSLSIADPETGEPIGAATFGVNIEYLN